MERKETREFFTESGIPLKKIYTPEDVSKLDYERDLGMPGEGPFTRGAYPNMYRDRPWRIFQITGTGTSEDTRERILYALQHGETGFILEPDQTTFMMLDLDDPEIECRKDDVGQWGMPITSLRDYESVLDGIPIERLFGAAGGAHPQIAAFTDPCYFSLAENRGIPLNKLRGTGHGDMFACYLASPIPGRIPPRHGLRLNCDLIEFGCMNVPHWVPVNICGTIARGTNINAYQELAVAMANAIAYIDEVLRRGRLKIDDFAQAIGGMSFMVMKDFFEEVAKLRAARRMWYKLLTERYGAKDPDSLKLRMHINTACINRTWQQPLNNIVRGTYEAMAAAMGGAQSLGISAYDEAISTPTENSLMVSIRTQQILQLESGITSVVDPLGGSYFVESLTNEIESKAWEYLGQIEDRGGLIGVLESGWLYKEAYNSMLDWDKQIQSGEKKLVGLNCYTIEEEPHPVPAHQSNPRTYELAREQLDRLRRERDSQKVQDALDELRGVLRSEENFVPAMMAAVKSYATIGEISRIFREEFGVWTPPEMF